MKKIVKLFGIMTIAAALLISCKPSPNDDPTQDPTTDVTDDSQPPAPGSTETKPEGGDGGEGGAGNGGNETPAANPCKIEFANLYNAAKIDNDGYTSIYVEFEEVPSDCQWVYNDTKVNPDDQWGNPFCAYSGAIKTKECTVVMADAVNQIRTQSSGRADCEALGNLILQNIKDGAVTVKIVKSYAVKADGSKVAVDFVAPYDGACTITK